MDLGELEIELDEEKVLVKLSRCLTCYRLASVGAALCDFERGLIDGVLENVTGAEVLTKETLCWGLGDTVCQFEAYADGHGNFVYKEEGLHSDVQLRLLTGIADQAELAVENLRLVRSRRSMETRDELTGLYNFRHLREHAVLEIARATRYSRQVTFVMIDLDDFAQVNQEFGRDVGDTVLRHWADSLRSQLRGCDLVCRYGADEFLLVLPETAESQADVGASAAVRRPAGGGLPGRRPGRSRSPRRPEWPCTRTTASGWRSWSPRLPPPCTRSRRPARAASASTALPRADTASASGGR